jgi:tetratricopeptide (TPR) repeat protein
MKSFHYILIGLGVLGFAGAGTLYWVYQDIQKKQASEEAFSQGQAAWKDGDISAALEYFSEAFSLSSDNPEPGYVLFDEYLVYDIEKASQILDRLEASEADREQILSRQIELALVLDNKEAAGRWASELETFAELGFAGRFARLLVLFANREYDEGLTQLTEMLREFPNERSLQMVMAGVLAAGETTLDKVRAKERLFFLIEELDSIGLEAAFLLLTLNDLPVFDSDLQKIGSYLERHPFASSAFASLDSGNLRRILFRLAPHAPAAAYLASRELVDLESSTPQDLVMHIELAFKAGDAEAVDRYLQRMERKPELELEEELLLAKHAFRTGNIAGGLDRIGTVLSSEQDNQAAYRLLAGLITTEEIGLTNPQKVQVFTFLSRHPSGNPRIWLAAIREIIAIDPQNKQQYIEEAIVRFGDQEKILLASWLVTIGEGGRALEVVPEEMALKDSQAILARSEALLQQEAYDDAIALLTNDSSTLTDTRRVILLSRVFREMGEEEAALNQLERALSEIEWTQQDAFLLLLAEEAGNLGAESVQRQAYDLAYNRAIRFTSVHAITYFNMLLKEGSLEMATDFALYCRNQHPDDPVFVNNYSYLRAIQLRDLDACVEDMEEIVAAFPDVPQFRGTLVLTQILNNQAKDALAGLQELADPQDFDTNQERMIFALLLATNGHTGLAHNFMESVRVESLLQAELDLLISYGLYSSED